MPDRITGMEVLARVAALGSLSATARALGMSQTMAAKHVAALEDRLGVRLLHRSTRRVVPTEAGRRYLEAAERILADLAEAEALAAAERVEVSGTLRLAAPVSFGTRELAPLLARLAEAHPDLAVELGLNDRVVDLVEEGWDVAVRVGRLRDGDLVARRLAPCRLLVAASPDYLARRGTPRRAVDLAEHNCLGYTLSEALGPRRWSFGADGAHAVPVRGNLRANNGDALVAAAVAGQGIVYEPTFLLGDEIRAGRLVALDLDVPPLALEGVHAVYPGGRHPPAKVRALVDFLTGAWGPVPPWDRDL